MASGKLAIEGCEAATFTGSEVGQEAWGCRFGNSATAWDTPHLTLVANWAHLRPWDFLQNGGSILNIDRQSHMAERKSPAGQRLGSPHQWPE